MLLAVLVSLALALGAPFIGELRRTLQIALPGHYVWIVNGVVGLVGAAVALSAVLSIRERRLARYALIAMAVSIAVVFARQTGNPAPAVAAVEHFHFVQYGFITWLFYRAWWKRGDAASLVLPAVVAFIFGIAEEWWQWFLPVRVGELKDVLLNTVAIACGLMVSIALSPPKWLTARGRGRGIRDSAAGVLVALLALAAFTWTVHVGHVIADSSIGEFRSRYSAAELISLSADRAARWATAPPLRRITLGREDQYRSEGEAHVRARNDAWERGEVSRAWGENLILEKYFAAVLDTPSHISLKGHRWQKDHRSDAEQRLQALGTNAPGFVSLAPIDTKWGSREVAR